MIGLAVDVTIVLVVGSVDIRIEDAGYFILVFLTHLFDCLFVCSFVSHTHTLGKTRHTHVKSLFLLMFHLSGFFFLVRRQLANSVGVKRVRNVGK